MLTPLGIYLNVAFLSAGISNSPVKAKLCAIQRRSPDDFWLTFHFKRTPNLPFVVLYSWAPGWTRTSSTNLPFASACCSLLPAWGTEPNPKPSSWGCLFPAPGIQLSTGSLCLLIPAHPTLPIFCAIMVLSCEYLISLIFFFCFSVWFSNLCSKDVCWGWAM